MIWGILTAVLSILAIVMFTQPALAFYTSGGGENVSSYQATNGFDMLKFSENQNTFLTIAIIFMILTLVFAGLTLIFSIVNSCLRATNAKRQIGAKIPALFFFLTALVACAMLIIYANDVLPMADTSKLKFVYTIGWGMIVVFVASLLSLIFAPRKKRKKS